MKKQGKQDTLSTADKLAQFVTVWKAQADEEIEFFASGSFTIDWGDGCVENHLNHPVKRSTHQYVNNGTYTVRISGAIKEFSVGSCSHDELIEIKQWGVIQWETMAHMFSNAINMVFTATDTPDTSKVEDMSFMFFNCQKFNSPIEHWDTKRVENMKGMLRHAQMFNQSLANMDLSSVEYASCMLMDTPAFDQDLRDLNIGNKVNTDDLFGYGKSLADYKRSGCCKHNEKYGVQEQQQAVYSVLNG